MPTYDYACAACGHRFERFESIHDDAPKACSKCGKKKARRMLGTGAGLIFKGGGFYVTDYKKKKSPGASGDGEKTAGGTEKKPDAPAEKKKEEKERNK